MRKIVPLFIIGVFLLSGIQAVAIPDENVVEKNLLATEDIGLEIILKGGLFGYHLTVENTGTEPIIGNLTMNITTTAWIMLKGQTIQYPLCPQNLDLSPGEKEPYNPGPVIGIGPATITIKGEFIADSSSEPYLFETTINGFIFLFYSTCDTATISLP